MSWRLRLAVAAGCLAGLLVVVVWLLRRPAEVEPKAGGRPIAGFPLKHLPHSTRRIGRTLADDGEPPQASWSRRSEQLCGGFDVFGLALIVASTGDHHEGLLRALAKPRAQLRAALACGQRFAQSGDARVASYTVSFTRLTDGGKDFLSAGIFVGALDAMPAQAAPSGAADLPSPYAEARCFLGWGPSPSRACRRDFSVTARLGATSLWAYGKRHELAALGSQTSQGSEAPMLALADTLSTRGSFTVARDDNATSAIVGSLWVEPFPETNTSKLRDVINDAADLYALANDTSLGEGEIRFVAEADNPARAEAGAHALRKYAAKVAQALKGRQPLSPGRGTEPREVLEFERVEQAARRRAWPAIDVSRRDRRFELGLTLTLLDEERPAVERYVAWRRARWAAAAQLVDALLSEADVRPALRALGGEYLVKRAAAKFEEFFEGDFECAEPPRAELAHLRFREGVLLGGTSREMPLGRYRFVRDVFGHPAGQIWREETGEVLEVTSSGDEITLRSSTPSRVTCRRSTPRAGFAPPPRRAQPISFDLPKPARGHYYTGADLRRMGWRVEPLDDERAVARGFGPVARVCHQPLACSKTGDCITLEKNLEVFRSALEPGQERVVSCQRAEVGRCGSFRYFLFDGDIHRYEVRWFDASGALVAQRNSTDYDAYCGGAMHAFSGRVPYCTSTQVEELICGRAGPPLMPPLRDLQQLLRSGLGP